MALSRIGKRVRAFYRTLELDINTTTSKLEYYQKKYEKYSALSTKQAITRSQKFKACYIREEDYLRELIELKKKFIGRILKVINCSNSESWKLWKDYYLYDLTLKEISKNTNESFQSIDKKIKKIDKELNQHFY